MTVSSISMRRANRSRPETYWFCIAVLMNAACSTEVPSEDVSLVDSMASTEDVGPDVSSADSSGPPDSDGNSSADGAGDGEDGIPGTSRPYCSDGGRGVLPHNVGDPCYEPFRCYWDWDWCRNVYEDWTSGEDVVCVRACGCSGLDTSNEFSYGSIACAVDEWGSIGSADPSTEPPEP